MNWTAKDIERLLRDVFGGDIHMRNLPTDLYRDIAEHLRSGVYDGFGGSLTDFAGKDLELLSELRTNIYMFSGAKTYQQVREMSDVLATTDTWKQFREGAREVFDRYNKTYLRTEWETAKGQAQCAVKWQQIQDEADVLPILTYSAVMDKNTSDICASFNGITAPVGHAIWKRIAPLNHWRCRCLLEQHEQGRTTKNIDDRAAKGLDDMQDVFKMNPGEQGYAFSPKHPYFEVAPKDKEFAKRNFDLPIPKDDK